MSAEPLSKEERERLLRWAATPENAEVWKAETAEVLRWEATVRAAEAERDRAVAEAKDARQAAVALEQGALARAAERDAAEAERAS